MVSTVLLLLAAERKFLSVLREIAATPLNFDNNLQLRLVMDVC